jgi:hypothetical protein
MQGWHGARDAVIRDTARTVWYKEPRKDGCSGDVGQNGKASMERNQGLKKRLCLSSERTLGRIFGKTIGLEIVKQIVGIFSGL